MNETENRTQNQQPPQEKANAGRDFVKMIGPVGCVMFTVMFVMFLLICFTPKEDVLGDYTPPYEAGYYKQNPEELLRELEENILPMLDAEISCETAEGKVKISIEEDRFWDIRAALIEVFPQDAFEFVKIQ